MFKWTTLKKLCIRLGIVAALALLVLGLRALNGDKDAQPLTSLQPEVVVPNEALPLRIGSGWATVAENDTLQLDLCFNDGNIAVTNKQNGYVWRSAPTDEEMALEKSNDLWQGNIRSPLYFTYITDYASTDDKHGNVFNQNAQISVYDLPGGGVRVYFVFAPSGITLGYELRLHSDHLEVTMPSYLISDPGEHFATNQIGQQILDKSKTFILTEINLFPFFGATRGDMGNQGYLMVPDGTGALMRFDSDRYINSQFLGHVYGPDLALYNNYDKTLQAEFDRPSIDFPVFGIVRDGNSLLGIIHQGETQADIICSKAKVQTGFNTAACRFVYRMKYKILTNTSTGDGYFSYTRFPVEDQRGVRYYFGSGAEADYVGMAKTYRRYLMETTGLTQLDESARPTALQLTILMGTTKRQMIGTGLITMTTFEEAAAMLRDLKAAGLDRLDVTLRGWAKRGDQAEYPDRFPIEASFGGEKGLQALADTAKELGYPLYLYDDTVSVPSPRGKSVRRDTIYNIQDNALFNGSYANPSTMARNLDKLLPFYARMGVTGLEDAMLGWFLTSDFNKNAPLSRADMKAAHIAQIDRLAAAFGGVRLETNKAYALRPGVTLSYLNESTYRTILDESVPFYPIALHGLVPYISGVYNWFNDPETDLLHAVEMGTVFGFKVTEQPTALLRDAVLSYEVSTQYQEWREDIVRMYSLLDRYLTLTSGRFVEAHERLTPEVVRVTYEGGIQVWLNYGNTDYAGAVAIPAKGFIVTEGGQ